MCEKKETERKKECGRERQMERERERKKECCRERQMERERQRARERDREREREGDRAQSSTQCRCAAISDLSPKCLYKLRLVPTTPASQIASWWSSKGRESGVVQSTHTEK
jgi:hypothetical protein